MTTWLCSVALVAWVLPACAPASTAVIGYVEGEYVRLAPLDTARIIEVAVRRGERVRSGDRVALVETTDAQLAVRDAEAKLAQASAELANLRLGRRPEEIAVIEASLAAAKAQAQDAERALERRRDLARRGFTPQADLDQAQTAVDVATARIGELAANLAVARLASRPDEISAAQHRVDQASAALDQARWRLAQRSIASTAPGRIVDIIRRAGEVAGPNAPIISMLPDGALKLKLYMPERLVSSVVVGDTLAITCDGCPTGLSATVSYVSPEPEFTPPVIYSLESRQKLMFLVEARPTADSLAALQPGQIIDARLTERRP